MTRVIGVVSGKGGVGKTTIVLNLGVELATKFKKRVTIVDCNVTTSHLSISLGMHWCPITLNQVLKDGIAIENAIYTHPSGMKIIPASLSVKDMEGLDISELKKAIRGLLGKTDIVILDSAPGLSKEALMTMEVSDEILFVTNPYVPAVMDIVRADEILKEMNAVKLGIVLNMATGEEHELSKKEIEELTEIPIITTIPFDKNVLKSLAAKQAIVEYNPDSKAARAVTKLAEEITGEKAFVKEKRGFFSSLLKILGGR